MGDGAASTTTPGEAAKLAVAVLDAEAERQAQQASASEPVLFADDLLPGVGEEQLTLRQGLATGGVATFVVLLVLTSLDELESATLGVLAPDIRDSLGVSDGVIVFLAARVGRVPRARGAADGLARRSLQAAPDHRVGERRVRGVRHGQRARGQRLSALLDTARGRRGEVQATVQGR